SKVHAYSILTNFTNVNASMVVDAIYEYFTAYYVPNSSNLTIRPTTLDEAFTRINIPINGTAEYEIILISVNAAEGYIGAYFKETSQGSTLKKTDDLTNLNLINSSKVAASINGNDSDKISLLKMLIIHKPDYIKTNETETNGSVVVSSVVMADAKSKENVNVSVSLPLTVVLIQKFLVYIRTFAGLTSRLVAKHIISHARRAATAHQAHNRQKRVILVLLSSCITQGLGWLLGLGLAPPNERAETILSWIFVLCIALEGVWSIVFYIFIRQERAADFKRKQYMAEQDTDHEDSSKVLQNIRPNRNAKRERNFLREMHSITETLYPIEKIDDTYNG
ncbi:unnamed protein product, partial [Didymodactylos carnosus]